tara:strand:+ start:682 stop:1848 length:1167 start_codon:yes stop_codon:yes gene_type:complete
MSFFFKLKKVISEKRLFKTLKKKIYPYFIGFLLFFKPNDKTIKIYVSKGNKVDKKDLPLAERIFKSYKQSKMDQEKKSDLYKPASLWQSHINNDFSFLLKSCENNDVEKFLFFLQNFGNWNNYLGVENQDLVKKYNKNPLLKKFLSEEIFGGQLKLWRFFNKDSSLSEIQMPRHGNQIGATVNDKFVVIGSFLNDIYAKNLKNYFKEQQGKILEIGGGYGKFAYYLLKNLKNFTYINFDIPETLTLSSYYLSKSFPSNKTFFYGEQTFTKQIENDYDLIFLPPWEIETLENNAFDLAINKNSLGEMQPETAKNYIKHIHRISKYFFSMNHEYFRNHFSDGKRSLINKEYNIDGKFRELIRYPDLGHLTYENNKIDFDSNTFFYIYEKK